MIRHLPNTITVLRGLCGPVVLWLLLAWQSNTAAFWVFVVAVATDMVDGFVARRLGAESEVALFLDPFADKLLTGSAWAALALVGHAPLALVGLVLARDFFVGVVWAWGSSRGRVWPPRPLGQTALAFEGVAIAILLFHGPYLDVHWPTVGTILGAIALALSGAQLLEYAWAGSTSLPGPGPGSRT